MARRVVAGNSFLDRSKVCEGLPYWPSIEQSGQHDGARTAGESDGDNPLQTLRPRTVTLNTVESEPTQGGRGGGSRPSAARVLLE